MEGVVEYLPLAHGGDSGNVGQHSPDFLVSGALPSLPVGTLFAVGLSQNERTPPYVLPLALVFLYSSQPDRCVVDEGSSVVVENCDFFLTHSALL